MRFHGSVPLGIKDTVDGLKGPVTLEGAVALDLGVGAKTLRLDDVFGGNKPTVSDQEIPVTLTLLDATRDADGDTRVSVEMGCPSKSRARSFTHGGPYYGFALIDPNGKRYTQPNGTGTSGGTNKAKVKFSFSRLPRVPGKWSLTFTTPEKTVKKEYPFTIRDVPVP